MPPRVRQAVETVLFRSRCLAEVEVAWSATVYVDDVGAQGVEEHGYVLGRHLNRCVVR